MKKNNWSSSLHNSHYSEAGKLRTVGPSFLAKDLKSVNDLKFQDTSLDQRHTDKFTSSSPF